jgi:hypothetical protein
VVGENVNLVVGGCIGVCGCVCGGYVFVGGVVSLCLYLCLCVCGGYVIVCGVLCLCLRACVFVNACVYEVW